MELHGNVAEDIWGPTCNECMINSGDPMQLVCLPFAGKIANAATVSLPGLNKDRDAEDFVLKEIIEPAWPIR